MSSAQLQWLGLLGFFGIPVAYFLTGKSWSRKQADYYAHLSRNSALFFLQGKWTALFSIVWGAFFLVTIPLSGFLFWASTANSTSDRFHYDLGLAFFAIAVSLLIGWMKIFFEMRMAKVAFWWTLATDVCVIGFISTCGIFGNQQGPLVMFLVLAAWMILVTIWTFTAAYVIPPLPLPPYSAGPPSPQSDVEYGRFDDSKIISPQTTGRPISGPGTVVVRTGSKIVV